VLLTLGRALKVTGGAPNVVNKCSSKRCLHTLEIQCPGWITRHRDKLRILSQNHKVTDRVHMALGVLNGSGSRGRFCRKEGMPHCDAFTRKRSWKQMPFCAKKTRVYCRAYSLRREMFHTGNLRSRQGAFSMVLEDECWRSHDPSNVYCGACIITLYRTNYVLLHIVQNECEQ